ncbi:Eco57I restriction-modification methylase domain-containing protein [Rhizobium leguminosarum]|uniref:Eco57I restriction-modification methylase domain-containing protein n=1 Tax=Rhizobium leguminosarum TaxID=384 RepID=UPI001C9807DE|nr:hypothetical protein [Rhizobium leguminosarum]MBY5493247.1 SAM-dependent DNA methyltransferase [Rhizobium leguminosarum]MBY5526195.1 SAM-dependent DNA methyltransferase [Rhizobium leguminosarum]
MTQHYISTPLRRTLEKTIKEARIIAEAGAADAIRRLGVAQAKAPMYLSDDEKELRRHLRAHARTLGDSLDKDTDEQQVKRLVEAAAYAHWHRMLFARFLSERGLLRHPEHDVPITLEDCREIAQEEGAADAWAVAERYAASMLPAVFRIDDPVLSLTLDAAQNQSLHRLVTELNDDVFQAEDSLGWTYQFWRAAEKDAVNKKGDKIGADEISAVTQLFTEPYMVRFLLHNTIGAWWAGKILARNPDLAKSASDEDSLRAACHLPGYFFDMLRFVREGEGEEARWRPAAGTFPGWPTEAKDVTMLDPCCGSGHFLTEALTILSALRQAEEGLSPSDSVSAVLRDNLHGLEIDGRCVQIAAFAVALVAWRIGGWQTLSLPHIAWVGAPPPLPRQEFIALAQGEPDLQEGLNQLWTLFVGAPSLGSFIDPKAGDLVSPQRLGRIEAQLDQLITHTRTAEIKLSASGAEGYVAARGMADAISILSKQYVLTATNVPFLGRGKQSDFIKKHLEELNSDAKGDIATAMLFRLLQLTNEKGTVASVTPHGWLFTKSYTKFRKFVLSNVTLSVVATLGEEAWLEFGDRGPLAVLTVIDRVKPSRSSKHIAVDALPRRTRDEKISYLTAGEMSVLPQEMHTKASNSVIMLDSSSGGKPLIDYCEVHEGLHTGDYPQFGRKFWELPHLDERWRLQQGGTGETDGSGGCEHVLLWENGQGRLISQVEERLEGQPISMWIKGAGAWGRRGLTLGTMRELKHARYFGALFTHGIYVITPREEKYFPALLSFAKSRQLAAEIRKIDKRVVISRPAIEHAPFDVERWGRIAQETVGGDTDPPLTMDPTQWTFHGHPARGSIGGALHIGLARLCGYRWPAESGLDLPRSQEAREWSAKAAALPDGDYDGLLAIGGVAGEKPLADRLRAYLAVAFGGEWTDTLERRLVAEADQVLDKKQAKDGSLETWLRDRAFRQHCALFHQRPFLWHIWDGLKDGFSVFVQYHRFTQANLRKLTYTTLGDWLRRAKDENNDLRYEKGRELQQMLEKVLEGEAPYDIFVRWKSLAEQPVGWAPDLDDGVRINIRPFIEVGILREQPKGIKWTKDRGNDVPSAPWYPVFKGERINDHHTTQEEKRAAREGNPQMVAAK